MSEVRETELPGVGTRFDFRTSYGEQVGVLVHRSGRREILVYEAADPDACRTALTLSAEDTLTLVELLGASRVTSHLASMQQHIQDLAIDWLNVSAGSQWVGHSLAEAAIHTRTGVSVVAILRGSETISAPSAEVRIEAADRLVAVGRPEGVAQLDRELSGE
jgi:TrkA domain protein